VIRETAATAAPLPRRGLLLWTFAALVVVWGNVTSLALASTSVLPGGSGQYAIAGLALVAVALVVARGLGLGADELGLRGPHLRGAALGTALGGGVALGGIAALRFVAPLLVGQPVAYAPLAAVGGADLVRHLAVLLPLGVVIPEEVAFRGVLVGELARVVDRRATIALAAVAFALWHSWIVLATIGETTLQGTAWTLVGIAGALAVVAAGGALFAWLRLRTGTLATTIAAHWSFNVVVLVGLWATR
jgi:membrane protease YdiL (CAAX protease family)